MYRLFFISAMFLFISCKKTTNNDLLDNLCGSFEYSDFEKINVKIEYDSEESIGANMFNVSFDNWHVSFETTFIASEEIVREVKINNTNALFESKPTLECPILSEDFFLIVDYRNSIFFLDKKLKLLIVISKPSNWTGKMSNSNFVQIINLDENKVLEIINDNW